MTRTNLSLAFGGLVVFAIGMSTTSVLGFVPSTVVTMIGGAVIANVVLRG